MSAKARVRSTAGRAVRRLAPMVPSASLQRAHHGLSRLDTVLADERRRRGQAEVERRREGWSDEVWLDWAYDHVLHREPDPLGREHWSARLGGGATRSDVLDALAGSLEAHLVGLEVGPLEMFHRTRMAWTQALPPAHRIIDLGGTSQDSSQGSLLVLGYLYDFEELVIIDLPLEQRHESFRAEYGPSTPSERGRISYWYRSMTDLGDVPDGSIDLVISGQTFEHISREDGREVLAQTRRILSPTGHLALDTPNRTITELQCAADGTEFINPDHEVEYRHEEMTALFAEAGLAVERAQGLGYVPRTAASRAWDLMELLEHPYPVAAIEDSYTLAYLVRPA